MKTCRFSLTLYVILLYLEVRYRVMVVRDFRQAIDTVAFKRLPKVDLPRMEMALKLLHFS